MLLRPNRFKWAWSCFSSAELAWCFTIFRPQDPTSLKKWVSLWKYPKKSWSISQIIILPQKLLAFLVFLSDHQTPPQCWASPTSGGALATGAHSVKLLSQLGAGCHHLLGGTWDPIFTVYWGGWWWVRTLWKLCENHGLLPILPSLTASHHILLYSLRITPTN
jgi:hypothetical protein